MLTLLKSFRKIFAAVSSRLVSYIYLEFMQVFFTFTIFSKMIRS